ncbi:TetR family transcriptional regulator [Sphaerisporangium rufum]|uniref:TetR family transcriptional regulator n=1 Tax=Sphaerisporangium rufum TaxID=1381558 RepID=A0A919R8B7_9ACTN|nr:TetR/AcrR family transcriptional regulator [Sphaerisporangium rufum]GII80281.1 TetR family transcriptional regulator [Sphaerisporangium rufum]
MSGHGDGAGGSGGTHEIGTPGSDGGGRRPGGRSARVRAAVRAATLAELAEGGFEEMTVDAVAARAGVHRTTVYRRWGTVAGLAVDALEAAGGEPWPVPDTGGLRGDLRALCRLVVSHFTDPQDGPVARAFIAAAVRDPATAAALHRFLAGRNAQAAVLVTRATERGELPAGVDAAEVVRVAVAPLYYRLFISGEPVDETVADRAADAAHAAAHAGVLPRLST